MLQKRQEGTYGTVGEIDRNRSFELLRQRDSESGKGRGGRQGRRPGGEPERGEKHGVQRPDRDEPAHRQLARQDRGLCAGKVPERGDRLYPGRYPRHLFPDGKLGGGGNRPRLHLLRGAGRRGRRRGRHLPGAEPQPGAAGDGNPREDRAVREPAGRGEKEGDSNRPGRAFAEARHPRGRHQRAQRKGAEEPDGRGRRRVRRKSRPSPLPHHVPQRD